MGQGKRLSAPRTFRKDTLPWLIYPVTMLGCLALFFLLNYSGAPLLMAVYVPALLGAGIVTFFERITPARLGWQPNRHDVGNDVIYTAVVQMLLPRFLAFLTAWIALRTVSHFGWSAEHLWVHHWPVGLQALLMLLFADLLRYGLHVVSHTSPILWRLHAVHHSPDKLYWLNVARFHPLEKSLQFLFDALPFILLGIGEKVLALYFVFYAVNGFFQHCNINLRFGWLNYVISSAELHRWHHSRIPAESNSNYGNNIIIWDLLFGTWFLPPDRTVGTLGLINRDYPDDFFSQLKTPFINRVDKQHLPVGSWMALATNALLHRYMQRNGRREYDHAVAAARNPRETQEQVLMNILNSHADTHLGQKLGFNKITSIETFQQAVPVHNYDMLQPYIERQEQTKDPWLNAEHPVIYNRTSGTTGDPKYIPVLAATLEGLKRGQRLFSYVQYQAHPAGFKGSVLGIVSPAEEGCMDSGTPIGSASGHIYRNMPRLMRNKYVVAYEVFEIEDYDIKYYTIARLALQRQDITYMGTANPSTFLRLIEIIVEHKERLLEDLRTGKYYYKSAVPHHIAAAINGRCKPAPKRAKQLTAILNRTAPPSFADLWPCLQTVVTWTGGSCRIALASVKKRLPPEARIFELGYLASELRGTVTIDAETNAGLPTLRENFFEFVPEDEIDCEARTFLTLDQLTEDSSYFLFVTTPAGLIRFDMNDLVHVVGTFENTPTLRFLQKGAGVTSITGEKLYETQLLQALEIVKEALKFEVHFVQVLADPEASIYHAYIELDDESNPVDIPHLTALWEEQLYRFNLEYQAKRKSGRLNPLQLTLLKSGTLEAFKEYSLASGQRESQFKTVALRYRNDFPFNMEPWCAGHN